ncbi:MAG TPA: PadR family transcriptional regulator [Candidatus Saccharibacteria bacterium]|nr:PadR family transcriptional regulator [Candidatus Saccharibacteria bacterium]HRK93843.1 PadR family transcriptional regulator [Candidatus Saccharibacteria bacterium]
MNRQYVESLVYEWDEVQKKGQLTFWALLAIYDGKKYAAEISEFMYSATNGRFEVRDQSLYRALRRLKSMGMLRVTEQKSPNSGPKRKYYHLTNVGETTLATFVDLYISPLGRPQVRNLLASLQRSNTRR